MNQILFSQRFALIFFTIICITFINSNSQTLPPYLQKIDYIPVIAHTNLLAGQLANPSLSLQRMKELGIYGVIATDLTSAAYSEFINNGLKVIPNQLWVNDNYVNYYTDGVYTIWEAEGKGDGSMGETEIYHNNNIGEFFSDSVVGIRTISNAPAGSLIYGPWYPQRVKYKMINDTEIINYTANYLMKITNISNGGRLPNGYEDSTVCTLEITVADNYGFNDSTVISREIKVSDFLKNGTYWNHWDTLMIEDYDFSGLKYLSPNRGPGESTGVYKCTEYMQYKIRWHGLSFLKLWVDKIVIHDPRGIGLYENSDIQQGISDLVSTYQDTTNNNVLAWFGANEPSTIDNYLCFRKVREIIKNVNPDLDIYTTFKSGYLGKYGEHSYSGACDSVISPMTEFAKKSATGFVSINLYNYHYPYNDSTPSTFIENNIHYVYYKYLRKLVRDNIPFSYSSQSGVFYDWEYDSNSNVWKNNFSHFVNPTSAQLLYHINLGMLYGAKELTLDPVFTIWNSTVENYYREGLIDYSSSGRPFTPLGNFFKDTISPRLKGFYGKKLKALTQAGQLIGKSLIGDYVPNYSILRKLSGINTTSQDTFLVDIGFLNSSESEYNANVLVLNRWYSNKRSLRVGFQSLTTYNNWTLIEYFDSTYKYLTALNDTTSFIDSINPGYCKLYSVRPSVMVGGEINADETITGTVELNDELRVKNGATLTINGTYNCHKSIVVDTGGRLKIIEGSTLSFSGGAKLIVRGRLTAKGDNSPITFHFGEIDADSTNGIVLQESSYDTLINCKILNAHTGIKIDGTTPYIDFCEITNSQNGMVLVNTYYDVENDTGTIIKEMQITNCATGIHMESSSAFLSENHTDSCIVGIRCVDGSFPIFGEWNQVGLNRITGEDTGIVAVKSGIILGMAGNPLFAGYNDCLSENILINASEESYVYGNYVWWGMADSTFDKEKFVTDEGSYIDYDYYLNESATGYGESRFRVNQPKQQVLTKEAEEGFKENNLTLREEFKEAIRHYLRGEGTEARSICRRIIQNNRDSVIALTALRLIANTINTPTIRDSVRTYLTQEGNSPANNIDFIVNSKVILAELEGTDFIESINAIISRYPNTREKDYLLYKKFSYYYFRENKRDSALSIVSEMETAFPEGIYTKIAKELIEGNKLQKSQNESGTGNIKKIELVNYPNPFNPVTTIKYSVLSRGEVNLSIFNILGERLKEIVNEIEDEGIYKVNVDMSRFSSGVYIYRIITPDYSLSKKMILIK